MARTKQLIADESRRIELFDFVRAEAKSLAGVLARPENALRDVPASSDEIVRRLGAYDAATSTLVRILTIGCFWGTERHLDNWVRTVQLVANAQDAKAGLTLWLRLRHLPATVLMYAGGIAALRGNHYKVAVALLTRPRVWEVIEVEPSARALLPNAIIDEHVAQTVPDLTRHYTPGSDYVHRLLGMIQPDLLGLDDQREFDELFDRFEYLLGLAHMDMADNESPSRWAPVGRFGWRGQRREREDVARIIPMEFERERHTWGPLEGGLFRGDVARAEAFLGAYAEVITGVRSRVFFG